MAEEARQENKNRPNIVFVLMDDALPGVETSGATLRGYSGST